MLLALAIKIYLNNMINNKITTLNYYIAYDSIPLNLNLWEAEMYYAAIPVQQLIGNLTYYSNFGRYELRLAESWERINKYKWEFILKKNILTENNELITPDKFKKSLERTMYVLSKKGGSPVLNKLKGYSEFISQNKKNIFELDSLKGIIATEDKIIFEFDKPVRSGLLQILSFAPYGFISEKNLNHDGKWKNNRQFISSGAYKVQKMIPGEIISLELRSNLPFEINPKAPKIVNFYQKNQLQIDSLDFKNTLIDKTFIIDSSNELESYQNFKHFEMVKEYMSSVSIGNLKDGIFKSSEIRKKFFERLNYHKNNLSHEYLKFNPSYTMYPMQNTYNKPLISNFHKIGGKITIRGVQPEVNSRNWITWKLLNKTLMDLNIEYHFSNSQDTRKDMTDDQYDIRIANPSIGGGIESWLVEVLFCSKLNSNLPNPNNKICDLINIYENDKISEIDFINSFQNIIEEENCLMPIFHFGLHLYFSNNLNTNTFSPNLSILRLDQIGLHDD